MTAPDVPAGLLPLRVALDVSAVPDRPVGAGHYILQLARQLATRTDVDLVLCSRSADRARWAPLVAPADLLAAAPGPRPLRLAWEQLRLGSLIGRSGADVHHGPHYTMPRWSPVPSVVTIHDLSFFDAPEWHERSKVALFRRAIARAAKDAAVVVCPSQVTAEGLRTWCEVDAEVVVAPHGVDPERFRPEEPSPGADASLLAGIDDRLTSDRPLLVFVGTLEPRKDVPTLVHAFSAVAGRHPDALLVLAGGRGWGGDAVDAAVTTSGLGARVIRTGYVEDQAIPALLRSAQAAAAAAVGLDDQLARGWTALGYAALMADRDFAAADRAFLRAIALDQTAAPAHRYRAIALGSVGRLVEAEREGRRAVELEPLSLAGRNLLLQILLAGRRYPQAITEAKAMATLSAEASEAWYARGWAHVLMGEREAGVDALLHGLKLWGVAKAEIAALRDLYLAEGFAGLCRAVADFFETQSVMFSARPTDIAVLRTLAGQTDLAFAALETAIARDDVYLLFLEVLPWFDELNNDPRWRPLVERARLVR